MDDVFARFYNFSYCKNNSIYTCSFKTCVNKKPEKYNLLRTRQSNVLSEFDRVYKVPLRDIHFDRLISRAIICDVRVRFNAYFSSFTEMLIL